MTETRASDRQIERSVKMMNVCDCFKMWQQPSVQDEDGEDDDDG